MENKRLLPLSIIILAISIIFSSIWIGQSLQKLSNAQATNTQPSIEKALLTDEEAAEYLGISINQFKDILIKDKNDKAKLTSYPTYRFIPYIELANGNKLFSKEELDKWIKHHMNNKYFN
ncbi:MAG: hypothetical protein JJT76_06675 [Clostridiaceae bacterium]|nr:hypothetical protein [Clostridiaceae bacterium]